MKYMKNMVAIAFAAALASPLAAVDPAVRVGAQVVDANGQPVGTIASVTGDLVVVDTGTNKASLPASAFGTGDKGLVIGMSRAELDAAVVEARTKAQTQLRAQLVTGAAVYGSDGALLGTVDLVEEAHVTIKTAEGARAKFPITAFAQGDKGLSVGLSLAQLKQAFDAAKPAPAPAPSEAPK